MNLQRSPTLPDMDSETAYSQLVVSLQRLAHLESVSSVLGWDEQVNLPTESAEFRGRQMGHLSDLLHREATTEELGKQITAAESLKDLGDPEKAVLREARKAYDQRKNLTPDFIKRRTIAQSSAFHAWVKAHQESDFDAFAPYLQEQLELSIEMAERCGHGDNPYDFFVDRFDPGMDASTIEILFEELRSELLPIVETISRSEIRPRDGELKQFDITKQETFLREVVTKLGLPE